MEIKGKKEPRKVVKKLSLSVEEKNRIQNVKFIMETLMIQYEAMRDHMFMSIAKIKNRLDIKPTAPDGFTRSVDIDTKSYEMVVTDTEIDKNAKQPERMSPAQIDDIVDKSKETAT